MPYKRVTMQQPPQVDANWLQNSLLNYQYKERVFNEIWSFLSVYPAFRVKTEFYSYTNYRPCTLACLYGEIYSLYRGENVIVPISIWLPLEYPTSAPLIYIQSPPTFRLEPNSLFNPSGMFVHPMLQHWRPMIDSNFSQIINEINSALSRNFPFVPASIGYPNAQQQQLSDGYQKFPPNQQISSFQPPQHAQSNHPTYGSHSIPQQVPHSQSQSQSYQQQQFTGGIQGGYRPQQPIYSQHQQQQQQQQSTTSYPADLAEIQKSDTLSKIKDKLNTMLNGKNDDLTNLIQKNSSITAEFLNKEKLLEGKQLQTKNILDALENDINVIKQKIQQTKNSIQEVNTQEEPRPSDIGNPTQSWVYNYLLILAEYQAIEDTLSSLSEAFKNKLPINIYLKHVRALGKEQFYLMSLLKKFQMVARSQM